ncbi:MAG TPA: hypothetical protein VKZ95_04370 [Sphingobacteriaceae bacterium]|nr:hypothetical protein [Sphingobacteriaceae bacterium]
MLKQNELFLHHKKCDCASNIIQRIKNLNEIRIKVDRALEAAQLLACTKDFSNFYSNPSSLDVLHSTIKDIYLQLVLISRMVNLEED